MKNREIWGFTRTKQFMLRIAVCNLCGLSTVVCIQPTEASHENQTPIDTRNCSCGGSRFI